MEKGSTNEITWMFELSLQIIQGKSATANIWLEFVNGACKALFQEIDN